MHRTLLVLIALLLSTTGSPAAAVINGTQITNADWTFMVAIGCSAASDKPECKDRLFGMDSLGMYSPQFCGGVLVKPRIVATSAHCLARDGGGYFSASDLYVGGGSPVLGAMTRAADVAGVEAIVIHPRYDRLRQTSDLALLVLKSEIANTRVIPFVSDNAVTADTDQAQIAGWGDIDRNGTSPMTAQFARITMYSQAQCAALIGMNFDVETMLCGHARSDQGWIDACRGDSGGPLVADVNGVRTLIGLASWGTSCAAGLPGIYTRLGDLLPVLLQGVRSDYPIEEERAPATPILKSVSKISQKGGARLVFALQRDGQAVTKRYLLCKTPGKTLRASTTGFELRLTKVRYGEQYSCRVRAQNAQGFSVWSKPFTLR